MTHFLNKPKVIKSFQSGVVHYELFLMFYVPGVLQQKLPASVISLIQTV